MARVKGGRKLMKMLRRRAAAINKAGFDVGFFEDAVYPAGDPAGRAGRPVADVAFANEYGDEASGIPERPFFRYASSQFPDRIKLNRHKTVLGDVSVIKQKTKLDVKIAIMQWSDPPNSPWTIRRKGKNDPLRFTDVLLNAVSTKDAND